MGSPTSLGGTGITTVSNEAQIRLVNYSRIFLDMSWNWLNDPEIRQLTMTPEFSREDQIRFFESLSDRDGYDIWGVTLGEEPIGAAGLKNQRDGVAEYWGYIGNREYWGRGHGKAMMSEIEAKARALGISGLHLKVATSNQRAISLYRRMGFKLASEVAESDAHVMQKEII